MGNPPLLLLLISLSLSFSDTFTHKLTHLHSPVDQLTVTFRRTVDIPQPVGHNPRGSPSLVKVKKQNATETKDFCSPFLVYFNIFSLFNIFLKMKQFARCEVFRGEPKKMK